MRSIQKVLIEKDTGKKYLVKDLKEDFHTSAGVISKKELQSARSIIKSNKNKEFILLTPTFTDLWEHLQRGPQIMIQKDIGLILAKTGLNKNSTVVDAGGGTGSLCFSLANVCKEITVYEIHPEHMKILEKNKELLGLKNVTLKHQNIYGGITEKELDLLTLDVPEPWLVLPHAEAAVKTGGFVIIYLPNLIQAHQFVEAATKTSIQVLEMIELLERKWEIHDKILRPQFQMLGHTGFLIFARKY